MRRKARAATGPLKDALTWGREVVTLGVKC
jgi:hypothetical protein